MMLHRNLGKRIAVALLCLLMFSVTSSAVFGAEPHEDPETAKAVFSSVALLRYYSDSLDFVLGKNPAEVESRLEKMPFASIPLSLAEAADSFAAASTNISLLIFQIDEDLGKLRELLGQFRLDEAFALADHTFARYYQANDHLKLIKEAVETTGVELKVSSALASSDLKGSYDGIVERILRIKEMLYFYQSLLIELLRNVELFTRTDITLEIQPVAAFAGDDIRFEGILTSEKKPLVGKEVEILVNGTPYITAPRTDADGRYQGVLAVPYWYLPELNWRALYYPRSSDIGLYLASLSPTVKLKVLFYEAELEVTVEDKAYPGRETTVSGRFDYGQSPPLSERRVEVYLDNFIMTEVVVREAFTQKIKIGAKTRVGKHIITVSSLAIERYSSVNASAMLNVTRATPKLDLDLPPVILTPGSIGLAGTLSSEVGPLSEALIEMGLGGSRVELVSSEGGAFDTRMKVRMILGIIGWQEVVIKVTPKEPGAAPLIFTTRVMVVNVINLGIFLAILAILGFFISWRLKRFRILPMRKRRAKPTVAVLPKEPAPAYSDSLSVVALTEESEWDSGEPRNRILYWYRLVVRFLLRIARISLRPQQTLREFAYEHSGVLGPGARYFVEFTRMVERVLYSQYRPTEADVENSRQLSLRVEEESKLEADRLPSGGEGRLPDEFVRRAEGLKVGGRVLMPSPWRWLATWLRRN